MFKYRRIGIELSHDNIMTNLRLYWWYGGLSFILRQNNPEYKYKTISRIRIA